jgi:sulfate-transporting ATPase
VPEYVYSMFRVGKTVPPKRQILKDISLSFFPGAKIGILGLNGAGKSSLLRIMAGVDTEFDGDAAPAPNLTIGHLEQEPKLDPNLTVRSCKPQATISTNSSRSRPMPCVCRRGKQRLDRSRAARSAASRCAVC